MTGGTVVILGPFGDNFGAGFTGGMAFVYDPDAMFAHRVNPDTLTWQRVATSHWAALLHDLVTSHADETSSRYASMLLHDWDRVLPHFWQVVPKDYVKYLPQPLTEVAEALSA
jgi:glutamate synthase (NADPH/NADH) large chain